MSTTVVSFLMDKDLKENMEKYAQKWDFLWLMLLLCLQKE